jgi:hypothetical protein
MGMCHAHGNRRPTMSDSYAAQDSVEAPSRNAFMAVPHDLTPLPAVSKALYIGTAGDVTLRPVDASADVVYRNVPAGKYLVIRASHIRATGTTATDIVVEA